MWSGSELRTPTALKAHKFSVHPALKSDPPAFIVKHTLEPQKGKPSTGQIRISRDQDIFFTVPVCFGIFGKSSRTLNSSEERDILIGDYLSSKELIFYHIFASSKNYRPFGTSDFGFRCFEYDMFRIYICWSFIPGITIDQYYLSVPYTMFPEDPKIHQEPFLPPMHPPLAMSNIGSMMAPVLANIIEDACSSIGYYLINRTEFNSIPKYSRIEKRDFSSLSLLDRMKRRTARFDPITGAVILDL